MPTAVIVGGGISGLSAAFYAQRNAKFSKVLLLEGSNRVGGWMQTLTSENGSKMELGPRSIRPQGVPGYNTLRLVENLGISDDIIKVTKTSVAAQNRFIYVDKKLHKLPNSLGALFSKQAPLTKSLALYGMHDLRTSKGNLEDESMYDFISRRFDPEVAKYLIDPMCRGIFAGDCTKLSVRSAFPFLRVAEQTVGNVLVGAWMVNRNARPKDEKCALYNKCKEERWSAYSFKPGLQHLTETLRDSIAAEKETEIVLNARVESIRFNNKSKAELMVNGETIIADHVFASIGSENFAELVKKDMPEFAATLKQIQAVDAVVVGIEFQGNVAPPTPGFGHLLPSSEDKSILGVIYDSCTFPEHDRSDKPSVRYTVMLGGAWMDDLRQRVPSMSDKDLGAFAVTALKTQLGIAADVNPVKVNVAQLSKCIPQYNLGHAAILEKLAKFDVSQGFPLSLIGSSYRGVSVNDCINNSRLAVERVAGVNLL